MGQSRVNRLKVRCLGGFEVWNEGRRVTGFESYRARAVLAYLACQRERPFSRDHLAGLLWPDRDDQSARRNLRQVLYNIRATIGPDADTETVVSVDGGLQLSPDLDCWVDVEEFRRAYRQGAGEGNVNVQALAEATGLYRGDFLADFPVGESPDFEFWLLAEQEALREQVVHALRLLIESYLSRGEFRIGLQFAHRLVAIEPLSEHANRQLIRLYALAGRRSRAIATYEQLRQRLQAELGVEPLKETTDLYQATLVEEIAPPARSGEREAIGPLIPMVGRGEVYERLQDDWRWVMEGRSLLTLVTGEPGIGKSRLVKSLLGAVSARRGATVLRGNCVAEAPMPLQPFPQLVRNAVSDGSPAVESALQRAPEDVLVALGRLDAELSTIRPDIPAFASSESVTPSRQGMAIARFLQLLATRDDGEIGEPVILFLDDLHHARPETSSLLRFVRRELRDVPMWILATAVTGGGDHEHDLAWMLTPEGAAEPLDAVCLERLAPEAVEEIAQTVVNEDRDAVELADFLVRRSEGLPLLVAEWINFLWSDGALVRVGDGGWRIDKPLAAAAPPDAGLEEVIGRRLAQLPNSTRRLAAMAAVIGPTFDAGLLQRAGDEHEAVIDVALELMLERWLARRSIGAWITASPERDIVMWSRGARRGGFEFSHELIRRVVYESVNPLRRQVMHAEVGLALAALSAEQGTECSEQLAYHFVAAADWENAWRHAASAARHAREIGAADTSLHYFELAVKSLDRLLGASGRRSESERLRRERTQLEGERQSVLESQSERLAGSG